MPYVPPHRKAAALATTDPCTSTQGALAAAPTSTAAPFRRGSAAANKAEPEDAAIQRQQWRKLSQGITSAINKVSKTTVVDRAVDIIRHNIERGRGIFCKSIMRSQEANPDMSDLFAALASVINRQFPAVGALLLRRLLIQWRRYYGRKHLDGVKNEGRFVAQLYIFGVCSDSVVLELLIALLCQDPVTDLEIDAASAIFKEAYKALEARNPKAFHEVLSLMRDSLEADPKTLSKRSESIVEAMLDDVKRWQKVKYDQHLVDGALRAVLEGNAEAGVAPHELSLDDPAVGGGGDGGMPFGDPEAKLDVFTYDPNYVAAEHAYDELKRVILGPLAEEPEEGGGDGEDSVGDWEEDEHDGAAAAAAEAYSTMPEAIAATEARRAAAAAAHAAAAASDSSGPSARMASAATGAISSVDSLVDKLKDMFDPTVPSTYSPAEDVAIRTRIVTSIQSSMSADEAAHKLMKSLSATKGTEALICLLVTEAAAQEKMYRDRHALIAARLCGTGGKMQYFWSMLFKYRYYTAEALEVEPLVVNGRIFAHLFATRSIGWDCMEVVDLATADDSQAVFMGTVVRCLCEQMGAAVAAERFRDKRLRDQLKGMFPFGDVMKVRNAIHFFEGVGGVEKIKADLDSWLAEQRQLGMKSARQ